MSLICDIIRVDTISQIFKRKKIKFLLDKKENNTLKHSYLSFKDVTAKSQKLCF